MSIIFAIASAKKMFIFRISILKRRPPRFPSRNSRRTNDADRIKKNRMNGPRHSRLAFSLVELLVVIAILGMMTVLLVVVFNNFGKSRVLNAEGDKLVNLINLAGQNSAARNAMTALVAIPGDSTRHDSFGLFEFLPEATQWRQISKWETLSDGILAEFPNPAYQFSDYPAVKPSPDFPGIQFLGASVPSFKYLIFLPSRSLIQGNSAQLRLVEGYFPPGASAPVFTRPGANAGVANFYKMTVLGTTGRPKIDRP